MVEWADLREELLDLILSKLFDKDRHNFRLVCRSWNAAATSSPYPYCPCLMFYDRRKHQWGFFQYNTFFFRSFLEFEFDKTDILCSNHGWLLMARDDDTTVFFFDPFNQHIVELHTQIVNHYTSVHFFHAPTSPECFILGIDVEIISDDIEIGLLRYGQDKWVIQSYETKLEEEYWVSLAAPVLHRGLLYFLDMKGDIATFDVKNHDGNPSRWNFYTNCLKFHKLCSKIRRHFLFKIKGEEALYAVLLIHDNELVNVFRLLEKDEEEKEWELVNDLGDKMLYLSQSSSFGDTARPKSMSNTICFPVFYGEDYEFVFYSMKTKKYHSYAGDDSYKHLLKLSRLDKGVAWINPISTQQDFIWYPQTDDSEQC